MERLHLHIGGQVQGVFFRSNTQQKARSLGITGWVRNTPDGDVEVVAEGERSKLEDLRNWCRRGPPQAQVSSFDEEWESSTGEFDAFRISY